jgi:hypothetical protein
VTEYLKDIHVVVAGTDGAGNPCFLEPGEPARLSYPGALDASFVWEMPGVPNLAEGIGAAPTDMTFPGPGGSKFGLMCFPPNSAGKLSVPKDLADVDDSDAGMHQSDTIDYEVIISGKVDIVLPGNQRRTLTPGSCLVMGGVMHAWENIYDEPCIYAAIVIGAQR